MITKTKIISSILGLMFLGGFLRATDPHASDALQSPPIVESHISETQVRITQNPTPTLPATPAPSLTATPARTATSIPTRTPTIAKIYPTAVSSQGLSNDNSYTNVSGNEVHSPAYSEDGSVPAGATARCGDGTYSFSQNHRGTCSHHGGVSSWL